MQLSRSCTHIGRAPVIYDARPLVSRAYSRALPLQTSRLCSPISSTWPFLLLHSSDAEDLAASESFLLSTARAHLRPTAGAQIKLAIVYPFPLSLSPSRAHSSALQFQSWTPQSSSSTSGRGSRQIAYFDETAPACGRPVAVDVAARRPLCGNRHLAVFHPRILIIMVVVRLRERHFR